MIPAIIRFFKGIKNAKSSTVDHDGREVVKYDEIEEKLGAPVYVAQSYLPEECSSNEVFRRFLQYAIY